MFTVAIYMVNTEDRRFQLGMCLITGFSWRISIMLGYQVRVAVCVQLLIFL